MPDRTRSWMLLLALAPLACGTPTTDERGEEQGSEGQDQGHGELCPAPVSSVAESYTVSLVGFPEVENDMLIDIDGELDYTGNCTITELGFASGQLSLTLACEHPVSASAIVTLTATATGVPSGLEVDDVVQLSSFAYNYQGGDLDDGVFRALSNINLERHVITDEHGLVFGAYRGGVAALFGTVKIEEQFNCPGWTACSDGDISGYIRASSGAGEVYVQIGEIEQLADGPLTWDVSLFQALLGGCHGNEGSSSVIRRP